MPDTDAAPVRAMSPCPPDRTQAECRAARGQGLCLALCLALACVQGAVLADCGPLPQPDGPVLAITSDSERRVLYIGGDFTTVGAVVRNHLAAIDLEDCTVTAWEPNPNGPVRTFWLSEDDATLYLGGDFTTIGGQNRGRLAAVSAATGVPTLWAPFTNGSVHALIPSVNLNSFYVAGSFSTVNTGQRHGFVELARLNGNIVSPRFDFGADEGRSVFALTLGQGRLFLAGDFTEVTVDFSAGADEDATLERNHLAALDLAPLYQLNGWNPDPGSAAIRALSIAPDGSAVYAGGDMFTFGEVTQAGIVVLDPQSGAFRPWDPQIDGAVHAILPSFDRSILYLGGEFGETGGIAHDRLAAVRVVDASVVDESLAAADPATVCALHRTEDLKKPGFRLYAGGGHCADTDGGPAGMLVSFSISPPETQPPLTRATLPGGLYNSSTVGLIRLECDDFDGSGCAETRYTIEGSEADEEGPADGSEADEEGPALYINPIPMTDGMVLHYFSIDHVGNVEAVRTEVYEVETRPPVTTAIPGSRVFEAATLRVTLSCRDDVVIEDPADVPGGVPEGAPGNIPGTDPGDGFAGESGTSSGCDATYYTTDGSIPTAASTRYDGPLTITSTTVLHFFSVDVAGNTEAVQREEYVRVRGEVGALSGFEAALALAGLWAWRRRAR